MHDRNTYEKANLLNADKLHDLIATLDEISYENKAWDAPTKAGRTKKHE